MYVIAKQAYGRERYYSVTQQGSHVIIGWTESISKAEKFLTEEDASFTMGREFMPNTVRYLKYVEV